MTEQSVNLDGAGPMPLLGLGVWQIPDGAECERAVTYALGAGYRHLDTAQGYENEASVGRALGESGIGREELFVTTKFRPDLADPARELERSLERLGLDYVDLYLVHWPQRGPITAWEGMEACRDRGYARAIGVSNFSATELEQVLSVASRPPAVNQVQFSPFENRRKLLETCISSGVVLEAYSPLGTGTHLDNPVVAQIASELGRSPAQILLRWGVQQGIPVIPKSTHRERIAENAAIFDFALSPDHMATLGALDCLGDTGLAVEEPWW